MESTILEEKNMFNKKRTYEKFEKKVWLSSPTMHGPELDYVKEAYETT